MYFFILTTILFGCSFVLLIRQTPMGAIYFISLGWIFGSLFTGYIVLILTHFIQFSFTIITIIASVHLIFALLVFCLLKIISKNKIRFQGDHKLHLLFQSGNHDDHFEHRDQGGRFGRAKTR